jgi:hypothetical protein
MEKIAYGLTAHGINTLARGPREFGETLVMNPDDREMREVIRRHKAQHGDEYPSYAMIRKHLKKIRGKKAFLDDWKPEDKVRARNIGLGVLGGGAVLGGGVLAYKKLPKMWAQAAKEHAATLKLPTKDDIYKLFRQDPDFVKMDNVKQKATVDLAYIQSRAKTAGYYFK